MTRQDSQTIKGVAIILMLFLHLFNHLDVVETCHNLVFINGKPLAYILSRCSNPVGFFLVIGGYGMYKVWLKGDRHRWTRVFKLLLHFWLITAIFVCIGHFKNPTAYPGSLTRILSNFLCYEQTYNAEMWFLLPYLVLSLISPFIFKLYDRFKWWHVVGATLFINLCTSFCISRFGVAFFYQNYWAYNPLLVFHLLFNFSLGATAARFNFFEKLKCKANTLSHSFLCKWGGVILLVLLSLNFRYNFFYPFLIISCIACMNIWAPFRKALITLGNNSMNMWMIHTWFAYYLFHNFIYSFEYPLLILIVLIIVSLLSSYVINAICKPIERLILTKTEARQKIMI